jgi:hypothetical protein
MTLLGLWNDLMLLGRHNDLILPSMTGPIIRNVWLYIKRWNNDLTYTSMSKTEGKWLNRRAPIESTRGVEGAAHGRTWHVARAGAARGTESRGVRSRAGSEPRGGGAITQADVRAEWCRRCTFGSITLGDEYSVYTQICIYIHTYIYILYIT